MIYMREARDYDDWVDTLRLRRAGLADVLPCSSVQERTPGWVAIPTTAATGRLVVDDPSEKHPVTSGSSMRRSIAACR